MKIQRPFKKTTLRLCIITILLWSPGVLAQTLQIMPVTLGMPHGALSNTIYITNRSTETETVQARPFLWSQSSAGDVVDADADPGGKPADDRHRTRCDPGVSDPSASACG